jgi:hypothetical protein
VKESSRLVARTGSGFRTTTTATFVPSSTRLIRLRATLVRRVALSLARRSPVRLQMALIVAVTGAVGLALSAVLLHVGVRSMAVRYPLALALAYLVFIGLLALWLRTRARDYLDLANLPDPSPATAPPACRESEIFSIDIDEFALPLAAVVFILALALATLYLVWIAPALFAELLVDSALSYALYRRMRFDERRHWLATAFERTALPFAATAVLVALAGAALSSDVPGAHSIGEVIRHRADVSAAAP